MRKRRKTTAKLFGELPRFHALVILKFQVESVLKCTKCKSIVFDMANGREVILVESICRDHSGGRTLRLLAHRMEANFESS